MVSLGFCREHLNFKLRHQAEVKYKHTCLARWEGRMPSAPSWLPEGLLSRTSSVLFKDRTVEERI